jgi:hypothetical protein
MAKRGLTASIPIWVRVPGIIALVLVGVLVSAMLLNAARDGGGHGAGDGAGHGRSGDTTHTDGGGHGAGDGAGHGRSGDLRR